MKWSVPLMWAGLIFAQGRPAFEAASVKASAAGDSGMSMHWGPGQVEWTDTSLRYFVQTAYGVHDYAYSGPAWLDSALYDVVAKLPANGNSNRYPDMLQTLLAERFKLVVHRETKDLPGLALMVDKRGPRISAKTRDFSIGVQAGRHPHCTDFVLKSETIRAASSLGARIVLSVYAPDETDRKTTANANVRSRRVSS